MTVYYSSIGDSGGGLAGAEAAMRAGGQLNNCRGYDLASIPATTASDYRPNWFIDGPVTGQTQAQANTFVATSRWKDGFVTPGHENDSGLAGDPDIVDYRAAIVRYANACMNRADGAIRCAPVASGYPLRELGIDQWMARVCTSAVLAAMRQVHPATGKQVGVWCADFYSGKYDTQIWTPSELFDPIKQIGKALDMDWGVGEYGVVVKIRSGTTGPWSQAYYTPAELATWHTDAKTFFNDPGIASGFRRPQVISYWHANNGVIHPTKTPQWDYTIPTTSDYAGVRSVMDHIFDDSGVVPPSWP